MAGAGGEFPGRTEEAERRRLREQREAWDRKQREERELRERLQREREAHERVMSECHRVCFRAAYATSGFAQGPH